MAILTLTDARKIMQRGRPWTFRLEFHDPSANSRKFWLCTGRGLNEPVEVHYARIGNKPTILIKDWAYVEKATPGKVAKGYTYAQTPFVRVRQTTIDACRVASQAPGTASPPTPTPVAPATPTPDTWTCKVGGVTVRRAKGYIEIVFDTFPATWQTPATYHSFKDTFEAFCTRFLGSKVNIKWPLGHTFVAYSGSKQLFEAIVAWLQWDIPGATTPLVAPQNLTGPYALIAYIRRSDTGWLALDQYGDKVMGLTTAGTRDLMGEFPHIQMVGVCDLK